MIKQESNLRSCRRLVSAAIALATCLFFAAGIDALTLPSQGYIVYTLSDGAIYRRMFNGQGAKIINAGKSPNINPKNGGIIVYVENSGTSRRAVLTDPDGLSHRAIGATYSGMSGVYWTDRGDRFTFMYGSHQWGVMDTLGNFKSIPVPSQVVETREDSYAITCSSDANKKMIPMDVTSDGGLGQPIIRGTLFFFNERAQVFLDVCNQNQLQNALSSSSMLGTWSNSLNGCFGTLSPNGEAYAHHDGGHGSVFIVSINNQANGTICAGNAFSYEVRSSSQDYSSYGIKWSNNFQWMAVRSEKDKSWNVVHLPPAGSTALPDNPPYQVFQSYGADQLYYGSIDMWVGPYTPTTIARPPGISPAASSITNPVATAITAASGRSISISPAQCSKAIRGDAGFLPKGIYFFKLQAGSKTICRPILVGK